MLLLKLTCQTFGNLLALVDSAYANATCAVKISRCLRPCTSIWIPFLLCRGGQVPGAARWQADAAALAHAQLPGYVAGTHAPPGFQAPLRRCRAGCPPANQAPAKQQRLCTPQPAAQQPWLKPSSADESYLRTHVTGKSHILYYAELEQGWHEIDCNPNCWVNVHGEQSVLVIKFQQGCRRAAAGTEWVGAMAKHVSLTQAFELGPSTSPTLRI